MDFTKSFKTECRRAALDIPEKAMADLMALGWKDQNAYIIAYGFNSNYSDEYNKAQIEKITSRQEFQKYLERTRKRYVRQSDKTADEEEFDASCVSKEQLLKDLYLARKSVTRGSKEWIDMTKQIADITQAKKDELKEEDDTIHYYLPITCKGCQLYIEHKKKSQKKHKQTAYD